MARPKDAVLKRPDHWTSSRLAGYIGLTNWHDWETVNPVPRGR
jgi:hypothetical protein